jgi:alpha-D-ribose 1-methylphosphonate 5-triphosphate diphosphatase
MMAWCIRGGDVLRDGALRRGDVGLMDGRIASPGTGRGFDARGLLVMPGLVDIHGDAHERCLQPRPGVEFDTAFALRDAAAQILASGITTAYLGVTLSWEPGARSPEAFRTLLDAMRSPPPGAELRLHLRFEADNFAAETDALRAMAEGQIHLLGFNDHTPGILRRLGDAGHMAKYASRTGISEQEFAKLARAAAARRGEVPELRARLAAAASRWGLPILSHDDATAAQREAFRTLGATICEFPMAEEVAVAATEAGEAVVMGAPNVVRGGSHLGWASAAPLAERGLVSVLASDYHWPALLAAPFRLAARGRLDLAAAWALVAENPTSALGLTDRGRIAEGLRGDVLAVSPQGDLAAVFLQGELSWLAPGAAARIDAA